MYAKTNLHVSILYTSDWNIILERTFLPLPCGLCETLASDPILDLALDLKSVGRDTIFFWPPAGL